MSLVEDILTALRIVLEYFGVPPDMLVPVWDSQLIGQYRSIVRMIGTNLPLAPAARVHFQDPLLAHRLHGYVDPTADTLAIPSFADVLWVYEGDGDSFVKTKNYLPPNKRCAVNQTTVRYPGRAPGRTQRGGRCVKQTSDHDALEKIAVLENELHKLRAQMALIVTAAPASGLILSQNATGTPLMSPPAHTSTPRCAAPPPPPPPPPPCPRSSTETLSVSEMIRQRRKEEKVPDREQLKPRDSGPNKGSHVRGTSSMMEVLKDLSQVQLRSVEKSPGGTPVGRRRSKGAAATLSDPAALIAEALKRKFAQHRHNNSSDKENSLGESPFGSPETPKVPLHIRRSWGRRHL